MPEQHRGLITFVVGLTLAKLLLGAALGWSVSVNEIHAQAEAFLAGLDVLDPKNTGNNPSFFLIFTPAISVQWLVWAVPFLALFWPRAGIAYSLLAGSFILGSYWQWSLNAVYGVSSLTRNLGLLSVSDLAGVVAVGALGLGTWALCVWLFIRLLSGRGDSPDAVGE